MSAKAGNDGNVRIKTEGGAHVILISESTPQVGGCKERTIKVYVEVKDETVVGAYISRMRGDESQIGMAVPFPHMWGYPLPILAEAIFVGVRFLCGDVSQSVFLLCYPTQNMKAQKIPRPHKNGITWL